MSDPYYPGPDDLDFAAIDRLQAALATVYGVSQVLARSLNMSETLKEVLHILEREANIHHSVVSLSDPEEGGAIVSAIHGVRGPTPIVRYEAGEDYAILIDYEARVNGRQTNYSAAASFKISW